MDKRMKGRKDDRMNGSKKKFTSERVTGQRNERPKMRGRTNRSMNGQTDEKMNDLPKRCEEVTEQITD